MLSIPSDFKDFVHISEGTSFWSSAWDKEELKSHWLRGKARRQLSLPSNNSHLMSWRRWITVCCGYFKFWHYSMWISFFFFFNTSWTYLSAILVFIKKKLVTEIQVVHHVDQDVEQVEHNSLSVSSISYNSVVVSLLPWKVDRQKALNP